MARPRASDHDEKRRAILEQAAGLFARHGYDRASLSMLAEACGMSKALLYHYYTDKSELLFDVIRTHLEHLLAVTAVLDCVRPRDPRSHLQRLAETLLEAYHQADSKHHVQINQLQFLPEPRQAALKAMQRSLVDRFAAAIAPCLAPGLDRDVLVKPLTMSLFGMLNWHHLWFREKGPMTRSGYARLAVALVVDGAAGLAARAGTSRRALAPAPTGVTPGRSR